MNFRRVAVLAAGVLLAGCATIVGDKTQLIGLNTTPDQATITITDEKGANIFTGQTPTTVTLQKADGSYFGGKTYHVRLEKNGFRAVDLTLTTQANGWYIAGNLVFGGLIGWLVVDPLTGAMYNITPENINSTLDAQQASYDKEQRTLSVVLLEDVPAALRGKLVRVN